MPNKDIPHNMKSLLIILFGLLAVFGNTSANLFGIIYLTSSLINSYNYKCLVLSEISNVDIVQLQLLENLINATINEKVCLLKEYDPISIQHLEGEILK